MWIASTAIIALLISVFALGIVILVSQRRAQSRGHDHRRSGIVPPAGRIASSESNNNANNQASGTHIGGPDELQGITSKAPELVGRR